MDDHESLKIAKLFIKVKPTQYTIKYKMQTKILKFVRKCFGQLCPSSGEKLQTTSRNTERTEASYIVHYVGFIFIDK